MQVVLQVTNDDANIKQVVLRSDTLIGRSPECQLKIASKLVSRRHCQILIKGAQVSIRDCGSGNGTFVNGKQIPKDKTIPILAGTVVMVGPLKFIVQFSPRKAAPLQPVEHVQPAQHLQLGEHVEATPAMLAAEDGPIPVATALPSEEPEFPMSPDDDDIDDQAQANADTIAPMDSTKYPEPRSNPSE